MADFLVEKGELVCEFGGYAPLLEKEGLKVQFARLFDRMTELKGENGLTDWIQMFVKTPFTSMDSSLKEDIIRHAVQSLEQELYQDGKWYADYVRLRIRAVKICTP